jgi:oxygen-independent coproporphyrinogen-3 oxidase
LLEGAADLPADTIYLGGGTPSLLSPSDLDFLLKELHKTFRLNQEAEISMEANPVKHDISYFKAVKDSGINRLSLGVQSFNDTELKILNRIHNSRDALQTVETLHHVGLTNFNIDLIYGIPGQTMNSWKHTLQIALACRPAHISLYLLQLSPTVPMARRLERGDLAALSDELEAQMYYEALEMLKTAGFNHYEISNLARPGLECRHNLIYWEAGPYTGLGAGAVSFCSNRRILNLGNLESYLKRLEEWKLPSTEVLEAMTARDLWIDALILGLRLTAGVNVPEFKQRYGIDILDVYQEQIANCAAAGLLKCTNGKVALTDRGYFLSNQALCQFL